MNQLGIIIASVREGRVADSVADWFVPLAQQHGQFEVSVLDLKEWNLPMLAEPEHPRFQKYQHQRTRDWSEAVARMDAFVIISPEYNYGTPPALVNALDTVFVEWHYKAAGMVTYGGVSAGLRGAQTTRQLLLALKVVTISEAVALPFIAKLRDADTGKLDPGEPNITAAHAMLTELARWSVALKTLRPNPVASGT